MRRLADKGRQLLKGIIPVHFFKKKDTEGLRRIRRRIMRGAGSDIKIVIFMSLIMRAIHRQISSALKYVCSMGAHMYLCALRCYSGIINENIHAHIKSKV